MNNKMSKYVYLIIVLTVILTACGQASPVNTQGITEEPVELTISAAASLRNVMEEIGDAYYNDNNNVKITYNLASSGTLQQQIENGADVDVFISAAAKQMNALQDKGLIIEETRKNLLGNRMVLVIPKDSKKVTCFSDLKDENVESIALGEPKSVPAGKYGVEVLTNLNLMDAVKSKIVYGKDVKSVLAWAETGNVDAAIVYETDAKSSDKVKLVETAPVNCHTPITYPVAVIESSKNKDSANEFIKYLCSSKSKAIFEKHGFELMSE